MLPPSRRSMLALHVCALFSILSPLWCSPLALSSWSMQSSSVVGTHFPPTTGNSSWIDVSVPTTVVGGLVQTGIIKDPFYGLNLMHVNSTPFDVPWWFATQFQTPKQTPGSSSDRHVVTFKGLNYAAQVWLNGHRLSPSSTTPEPVQGTFRYFDFDVTQFLSDAAGSGSTNQLMVLLTRPVDSWSPPNNDDIDLALSFVDWAPFAPDSSMGLWREVLLSTYAGGVSLRYPGVNTVLSTANDGGPPVAHLDVVVEVTNWGTTKVSGTCAFELALVDESIRGSQPISLSPGETKRVIFTNASFPQLNVHNPPLWWPWQMGQALMHTLSIEFEATAGLPQAKDPSSASITSHQRLSTRVGLRQVRSELIGKGKPDQRHRVYIVNGKRLLIRGGGWAPDLLLRADKRTLHTHISLARHLQLNAIRLEGKMPPDEFFDAADELGMLVIPGWCCCDAWQHWYAWKPQTYIVARESTRTQVKRLRRHPSILSFWYSSDQLPPVNAEKLYLSVFHEEHWDVPLLASASNLTSNITGPTGVKMSGPYSWEPPNYWGQQTYYGGAFGFLTEGGPGATPMTFASIEKTIPSQHQWPLGDYWSYHCGNSLGLFGNMRNFLPGLNARYGNVSSAKEFTFLSQVATYESYRAMFEAYSANKYNSTGAIVWMLNNAWPENMWHLYDWYFDAGGAFYGVKKANTNVHAQFSYTDYGIRLVNSLYHRTGSLSIHVQVLSVPSSTVVYDQLVRVDDGMPPDSVRLVHVIPIDRIDHLSRVYFVHLQVHHQDGAEDSGVLSRNTYWWTLDPDVLDWSQSNFYRTPVSRFANFKELRSIDGYTADASIIACDSISPVAQEEDPFATRMVEDEGNATRCAIVLRNPSKEYISFFNSATIKYQGEPILPSYWEDNMVSLMPGQSMSIHVTFHASSDVSMEDLSLSVDSWHSIIAEAA